MAAAAAGGDERACLCDNGELIKKQSRLGGCVVRDWIGIMHHDIINLGL